MNKDYRKAININKNLSLFVFDNKYIPYFYFCQGVKPDFLGEKNGQGSWAIITASRMTAQPANSLAESISLRKSQPPSTANTDSRLISQVAVTGCRYF